ncbi:MAG: helicase-related protein [Cyclobacteriaceae bacterium]|jgi:superfamily II DNA or RNA helicase|nr:helicase-related protein [Cyclobacteriaceae bacterium]
MKNIITAKYDCNGKSIQTNNAGMREMQIRVYEKYESQYILLKAPPASGKSRALMYVALEKLKKGLVKKIIVAVPERSIAKSFATTDLISSGFHTNWTILPQYDLCSPGGEQRKTTAFKNFMESEEKIILCTHATLRFAFDQIGSNAFNDCLIAIDEFHHVSIDIESKLGELLRTIMGTTNAHILAMTGSYFRGDSIAVLSPRDELKFTKVTYNYYEQLNGYKYLKSLGIGFHFYHGRYLDSISDILDINKKTIIHIPNVNASESTKEKMIEVDSIIDHIGEYSMTDEHGIIHLKTKDGKDIKVADLVNDNSTEREKVISYLRNINNVNDIDIIIALGMAKEGFDWPYCETTLTVGYRGSLTEIIQIIGRCTRDSENKTHAQFTNLIAEPDADNEEIIESVNSILKAIAASLLMEEVIAPKFNFKAKASNDGGGSGIDVVIKGFKEPTSKQVKEIIENDIVDLKAKILQSPEIQSTFPGLIDPEVLNKGLIPKVITEIYPHLAKEEVTELGDYIVASSVVRSSNIVQQGNDKLISFANRLVNVNELNMDLIYSINPFQNAFEIMSKQLSARVFKAVQQCIQAMRIQMTDDEAIILWPKIQEFYRIKGKQPSADAVDPLERRMAEALIYLRQIKSEVNQ